MNLTRTVRSATPSPSKQRLRLWLRLLRATTHIEGELRERLRVDFATTLPRFDVLAAVTATDGLTMTELSRKLMVSNGNVTGIVDRLVEDGLVVRESMAADRRAFRIVATRKGRARFEEMAAAHQGWIDELLAAVPEEAVEGMMAVLEKVKDAGSRKP